MKCCSYCGRENAETATHCFECGADLTPPPVSSDAPTGRFYRRPRLVIAAAVVLLLGVFITYRALRPTSYQLYERIKVGDSFSKVTDRIGQPIDSNDTTNGTDYLFAVRGHPDYPSMMGVPFPVRRIIRIHGGRVVSKGAYEDYYNPYAPGWAPKKKGTTE